MAFFMLEDESKQFAGALQKHRQVWSDVDEHSKNFASHL